MVYFDTVCLRQLQNLSIAVFLSASGRVIIETTRYGNSKSVARRDIKLLSFSSPVATLTGTIAQQVLLSKNIFIWDIIDTVSFG